MAMLASLAPFGIMLVAVGAWIAGLVILFNQHAKKFRPRPPRVSPSIPADQPASST
jgi:hypothetical protein